MPINPQLARLVNSVTERTQSGGLKWRSNTNTAFALQLDKGSVVISSRDSDGLAPYEFTVFNSDGVAVESISTTDLDLDSEADGIRTLTMLFHEARRSALGVSTTLSALIDEVEGNLPF